MIIRVVMDLTWEELRSEDLSVEDSEVEDLEVEDLQRRIPHTVDSRWLILQWGDDFWAAA